MAQLLQIDDSAVEGMLREELQKRLNHLEHRHTFWDLEELVKQTCMSRSAILDKFFYDERFAKLRFKIGAKWYFPARETEEFLLMWLREQAKRKVEGACLSYITLFYETSVYIGIVTKIQKRRLRR